jgi:hypothetical protein
VLRRGTKQGVTSPCLWLSKGEGVTETTFENTDTLNNINLKETNTLNNLNNTSFYV